MDTLGMLAAGALLAVLGYTLGLLQRQPARRVAVPLPSWPVASAASMPYEVHVEPAMHASGFRMRDSAGVLVDRELRL